MIESRFGYIDKTGRFVIAPTFTEAGDFHNGLARVKVGNKYGFIDKTGKIVIKPQFKNVSSFSDGYARITDGSECFPPYGFIDTNGVVKIAPQFRLAGNFNEGLARVQVDDKFGFIDKNGCFRVPPAFGNVCDFSEGLARVTYDEAFSKTSRWGYINKSGNLVIPPIDKFYLSAVRGFSEGLAPVTIGPVGPLTCADKAGYIEKTGHFAIEPKFREVSLFSEGLAYVVWDKDNLQRGFIDKSGNCVFRVDDKFIMVNSFHDGLALVLDRSNKCGYIDRNGVLVIDTKFECSLGFSEGLAYVKIGGKYGFIDRSGQLVVEPKYESVGDFREGYAWVEVKHEIGSIHPKSNISSPTLRSDTQSITPSTPPSSQNGCYIATAVYGSYDCPEVWTLRRYRDKVLKQSNLGRFLVRCYYAISPRMVRMFGKSKMFSSIFRPILDRIVSKLNKLGFVDSSYED